MTVASPHLPLDLLLQDWLGEADPEITQAVDEHLMTCDACGALFDEMLALREGIPAALRAGMVFAVVGGAFVDRLAAQGLRMREYRLPQDGSVNCSVAPDDDVLVGRLQAPLQGVQRLDVVQERSLAPGVQRRWDDVPFDPASGELAFIASTSRIRDLPAHTMQLTLVATDASGTRELGRYVFRHSPWGGGAG